MVFGGKLQNWQSQVYENSGGWLLFMNEWKIQWIVVRKKVMDLFDEKILLTEIREFMNDFETFLESKQVCCLQSFVICTTYFLCDGFFGFHTKPKTIKNTENIAK